VAKKSPGGAEVGRIALRVLPDTSKFAETLRAELAAIKSPDFTVRVDADLGKFKARLDAALREASALSVDIGVGADTSGMIEKIDAAANAAADSAKPTVNVDANIDQLIADIEAARKLAEAKPVKVKVESATDQQFISRLRAEVAKALAAIEVQIPLTIDGEGFRGEIDAQIETIRKTMRMKIPLEPDKALAFREEVLAQVRALQGQVKVPIEPDLSKLFTARVKAEIASAARAAEARIPLTPEGENLRARAQFIVAQVDHMLKIGVPVEPADAAKFRADIAALIKEMNLLAKVDPVKVPVKVDTKKAAAETKRASKGVLASLKSIFVGSLKAGRDGLNPFSGEATRVSRAISNMAPILLGLGVTFATLAPQVFSLLYSLKDLAGGFALMPALITAVALPVGALVIGFQGFGQALKDIGDSKKFNQDLKGMAPSAKAAARELKKLSPELTKIKKATQQALFSGMAKELKGISTSILPVTKKGFVQLAGSLNLTAKSLIRTLTSAQKTRQIKEIFTNTAGAVSHTRGAASALLSSFITLSAVGGRFLPGLAKYATKAAQAFDGFVTSSAKSGALTDFIQTALNGLKDLGQAAYAAAQVIGGIGKAAQAGGGATLSSLADGLAGLSKIVNSGGFQKALTQVFAGLNDGLGAVRPAIGPVVTALEALAPVIGDLARGAGVLLGAAITVIAEAFIKWAPTITQVVNDLKGPLTSALAIAITYLGKLSTFLAQNPALLIAIGAAFVAASGPMGLAAVAVSALVAGFVAIQPYFPAITAALTPLGTGFGAIATASVALWNAILPIGRDLLPIFQKNLPAINALFTQVFTSVRTIVNEVMLTIGSNIQRFVVVVTALWKVFGPTITSVVSTAFPYILKIISGVMQGITGIITAVLRVMRGDWSGAWEAIKSATAGAVKAIGAQTELLGTLVVKAVKGIGSRIADLGKWFYHSVEGIGKNIVDGIKDGITSNASSVVNAAKRLADNIVSAFSLKMAIHSPSRVMIILGRYVTQGLVKGMLGTADQVTRAAQTLANKIKDAFAAKKISKSSEQDALDILSKETKRFKALASERAKVADKLKEAQGKLADALKAKADFKANIVANVMSFGDVTSFNQSTASDIIASLKDRVAQTKAYTSALARLKKLGINQTTYAQLVNAGAEQGGAAAKALLDGGVAAVRSVNLLTKQLQTQANALGSSASAALYNAGIESARGLVAGLASQESALVKAARALARRIVRELKSELGIHSPSTVTRDEVGIPMGMGVAEGLHRSRKHVKSALAGVTEFTSNSGGPHAAATGGPAIAIENMYTVDPAAAAKELARKQKDLNAIYDLGRVA